MMNKEIASFLKEGNDIEGYVYPIEDYEKFNKNPFLKDYTPFIKGAFQAYHSLEYIDNLYQCFMSPTNDLSENYLLYSHKLLMQDLPGSDKIKVGEYRDLIVGVGGRICPEPDEIPELMNNLILDFNSMDHDTLEMHYRFEIIHPFQDGNGRIGRLLYLYDLIRRGLPVKNFLDNFEGDTFDEKRYNYYRAIDNFNNKNR